MKKLLIFLLLLFPLLAHADNVIVGGTMAGLQWNAPTADITPPTLTSATISGSAGTTWTFLYNENVKGTAGTAYLCSDYTVSMSTAGTITLTFSSGDGTNSIVCAGSPAVASGETVSSGLTYTTRANGIEDYAGNDMVSFTNQSGKVTNSSTYTAPSGAWYGPTKTDVTYESSAIICEKITVGQTGNLTKIGVYLEDKESADIKLALYNSTGLTRLSTGGAIVNASLTNAAYNDYTLGTPVAVTLNDVVLACFRMSAEVQHGIGAAVAATGYYETGVTYANFPPTTASLSNDSERHNALRVYVE